VTGEEQKAGFERLRLLIAEDDAQMQACLSLALGQEYEIAGIVDKGPDVLQNMQELHPDILLLDISLPGMSGLQVARQLRRAGDLTRIIFLTGYNEHAYVEEAMRIGTEGYVLKGRARTELAAAIRQVSEGRRYISPDAQRLLHSA
jgi:DNA-binding NarL/FixJ family response regulator